MCAILFLFYSAEVRNYYETHRLLRVLTIMNIFLYYTPGVRDVLRQVFTQFGVYIYIYLFTRPNLIYEILSIDSLTS